MGIGGAERAAEEEIEDARHDRRALIGLKDRNEKTQRPLNGFGPSVQYRGAAEEFIERTQKGTSGKRKGGAMKTLTCVATAAVMLLAPQMAQTNTKAMLLGKVLTARTIYVENRTSNSEIQNRVYLELAKWGRFQIVDSPKKADLVLRLSGSNMVTFVPAGEKTYVYDPAVSGRLRRWKNRLLAT